MPQAEYEEWKREACYSCGSSDLRVEKRKKGKVQICNNCGKFNAGIDL